jgi:hypothetical protein
VCERNSWRFPFGIQLNHYVGVTEAGRAPKRIDLFNVDQFYQMQSLIIIRLPGQEGIPPGLKSQSVSGGASQTISSTK